MKEVERAANRQKIRRLVSRCGVCNDRSGSHNFSLVANAPAGPEASELLARIQCGEWKRLSSVQSWRADADSVEAYLLLCGMRGGSSLFLVLSPFDLHAPDELLLERTLSQEDTNEIVTSHSGIKWQQLWESGDPERNIDIQ